MSFLFNDVRSSFDNLGNSFNNLGDSFNVNANIYGKPADRTFNDQVKIGYDNTVNFLGNLNAVVSGIDSTYKTSQALYNQERLRFEALLKGGLNANNILDYLNGFKTTFQPVASIYLVAFVNSKKYQIKLFEPDDEELYEITSTINWAENSDIIGRSSPLFVFTNSEANTLSVTGKLVIDSEESEKEYDNSMELIKAMKYPISNGGGIGAPPLWELVVYDATMTRMLIEFKTVRINSVSWKFSKVSVPSGRPLVTYVTFDFSFVDESVDGSQLAYTNEIMSRSSGLYFDTIVSRLQSV